MWTQFWDMHSGGSRKLKWNQVYIEAPEAEAIAVFYAKFGRNPNRVTCTCCGPDYSITESATIEEATAFHRNCTWVGGAEGHYANDGVTVEEFFNQASKNGTAIAIHAEDILSAERHVRVPREGYVWAGDENDED